MVRSRHDDVAAEPLDRLSDPLVVGRDKDSIHQFSLLYPPVDVFNQCFTADFDDRLSRETSGLITGRDDSDGAVGTHIPTYREGLKTIPRKQPIADTTRGTSQVPE